MGWTATLAGGIAALLLLALSALLHARRGIGRLSLAPWDYLLILSAILLLMAIVHGIGLWRQGWPLPWA